MPYRTELLSRTHDHWAIIRMSDDVTVFEGTGRQCRDWLDCQENLERA